MRQDVDLSLRGLRGIAVKSWRGGHSQQTGQRESLKPEDRGFLLTEGDPFLESRDRTEWHGVQLEGPRGRSCEA